MRFLRVVNLFADIVRSNGRRRRVGSATCNEELRRPAAGRDPDPSDRCRRAGRLSTSNRHRPNNMKGSQSCASNDDPGTVPSGRAPCLQRRPRTGEGLVATRELERQPPGAWGRKRRLTRPQHGEPGGSIVGDRSFRADQSRSSAAGDRVKPPQSGRTSLDRVTDRSPTGKMLAAIACM